MFNVFQYPFFGRSSWPFILSAFKGIPLQISCLQWSLAVLFLLSSLFIGTINPFLKQVCYLSSIKNICLLPSAAKEREVEGAWVFLPCRHLFYLKSGRWTSKVVSKQRLHWSPVFAWKLEVLIPQRRRKSHAWVWVWLQSFSEIPYVRLSSLFYVHYNEGERPFTWSNMSTWVNRDLLHMVTHNRMQYTWQAGLILSMGTRK